MRHEDLVQAIDGAGFTDPGAVKKLIRGAVCLRVGEQRDASPRSKWGGRPALPAAAWPKNKGRSMALVAQIDLAEQPGLASVGVPPRGGLLFFYDTDAETWGFDPKDAGSAAVVHVAELDASVTADWPADLPDDAHFAERAIVPEATVTLPAWDSLLVEELGLDEDELNRYQDLLDSTRDEEEWATRGLLAGHPDQIQGDMALECALVAAGLYCGDSKAYQDPRMPQFEKDAREWRLLLQVPSDEPDGFMWGDAGCLYYWIRASDLEARRFDRSWTILQCT